MATLQNIRNRSVLLLSVIGIAMLAFILGDFMQSQRSGGTSSVDVGEIFGEQIHIQDFEIEVEKGIENWKIQNSNTVLTESTITQIRDQVWNEHTRKLIMEKEYSLLGISISDNEWMERISGVHTHSEIRNIPAFQNPQTQEFDRTKVLQYLKQIDQDQTGEARERWLAFQDYLINSIKNNKYDILIQKSMFVTNEEAKIDFNENSQNIIFDYILIPFSSLNDTAANYNNISEKEIKKYYSDNIDDFQQEETRDVDFVKFLVSPSSQDDINTKQSLEDLKESFAEIDDYLLFARRNSDNIGAKFSYAKKDKLQDPAWTELFDNSNNIVLGPYESSPGVYRIAKIASTAYRPDSVEARHILVSPSSEISIDSVEKVINIYKKMIEEGADFGDLASKYSEDKGSSIKGGDLGWFKEGVMVDEFNEKCFTSAKGALSIAKTQFGIHLIQVTKKSKNQKKSKIVFIDRNIEPSSTTLNSYWNQASQFAGDVLNNRSTPFDSLINKRNLIKRTDKKVSPNKKSIVGLPNSRSIVRWMNEAEVGDVSEVFELEDSYIVAYLVEKHAKGDMLLEDVRIQIESNLKQTKKFHFINSQLNRISSNKISLEDIATEFSVNVSTIDKAVFKNSTLPGIGFEPELLGTLFSSDIESISSPIEGRSGIFIINVKKKDESRSTGDFTQQKNQLVNNHRSYSSNSVFSALTKNANLIDNRNSFY